MPESYVFTFGYDQEHQGRYVHLTGDGYSAREEMFRMFGSKWSMQYRREFWEKNVATCTEKYMGCSSDKDAGPVKQGERIL